MCAKLQIGDEQWADLEREAAWQVEAARAEAEARGVSSPEKVTEQRLLRRRDAAGRRAVDQRLRAAAHRPTSRAATGQRINMVTAIRRVLDQELEANPRVLVFGEDVGPKGGVHAVTLGPAGEVRPSSACSTPASTRKASSAARSAWRSPG